MIDIMANVNKFNGLVLLTEIRKIDSTLDCIPLQDLAKQYATIDKIADLEQRVAVTILTACLIQKRVYFSLSRKSLRQLLLDNANFINPAGFNDTRYKSLLAAMHQRFGIMELIQAGKSRTASIYKISEPSILEYLTPLVNLDEQIKQCLKFVTPKVLQAKK